MILPPLADLVPPEGDGRLPHWLHAVHLGPLELWQVLGLALGVALAVLFGKLAQAGVSRLGHRLARVTQTPWDDALVATLDGPLWLLLSALLSRGGVAALELPGSAEHLADVFVHSVVIGSLVWFALRFIRLVMQALTARADGASGQGRAMRTHVEVSGRFAQGATWLLGAAVFLLQFEVVRSVGVSLLASAGIAGVVLGLAAQKSVAQLFAGIQLSVTQPVRLGDLVVVDGKFGEVEEIRLTYVILRTWDAKRLVMPISQFLEKPFENWSLGSLDLVSAFTLKLDFAADVDVLRAEVKRLLSSEPGRSLHDGRAHQVLVTDADEKTVTVRISASVADAARAFDLQCALRESLLAFARAQAGWLPRGRSEMVTPPPAIEGPGKSS